MGTMITQTTLMITAMMAMPIMTIPTMITTMQQSDRRQLQLPALASAALSMPGDAPFILSGVCWTMASLIACQPARCLYHLLGVCTLQPLWPWCFCWCRVAVSARVLQALSHVPSVRFTV